MNKVAKRTLIAFLCVLGAALLVVGGYVMYVVMQYSRIEDGAALAVTNNPRAELLVGETYTAMTYNIGFGAYDQDYSFFMDTGVMKDGTVITGKHARADSWDAVERNITGALEIAREAAPDFLLLQEVDVRADRSYKIDQAGQTTQTFWDYASVYASNFHSAYLYYPLHEPIGASESGLMSLSRYTVSEAVRRSFPVDDSFPNRFFDLDRCFAVLRIPVEGGGELVLLNVHMSAYDEGGVARAAQMEMMAETLRVERDAGNWVIVGGDYNHALCGSETTFPSQQQMPGWLAVFNEDDLPEGYAVVCAENAAQVPTNRAAEMPYEAGVNFTVIIDGFIVSDNVHATAENIDAEFLYSDHNPVQLTFSLQ